MAAKKAHATKVGSLSPLLFILAIGAVVFAAIPLAIGEPNYAIPACVLFGILCLLALTDSLLSRHQDHVHGAAPSGATEQDGALPLMTVEITDPFGGEDHAHEIGLHDFPPGHPARRALRESLEAKA